MRNILHFRWLVLLSLLALSACNSDSKTIDVSTQPLQDHNTLKASLIGEWGRQGCAYFTKPTSDCNKPAFIFLKAGTLEINQYRYPDGALNYISIWESYSDKKGRLNWRQIDTRFVLKQESPKSFYQSAIDMRFATTVEANIPVLIVEQLWKKPTARKHLRVFDYKKNYDVRNKNCDYAKGDKASCYVVLPPAQALARANSVKASNKRVRQRRAEQAKKNAARCGLSRAEVAQNIRQTNYTEILKAKNFGEFHTDSTLQKQVNSASVPSGYNSYCEAAGAQVTALRPAFNQAITSSNKLVNGSPLGLTCSGNQSSASQASACNALILRYQMQQAAFACHYACEQGK